MSIESATILAALVMAGATILAAILGKPELFLRFRRSRLNITGKWRGWSIYIPIDKFNKGSECIYKVDVEFKQVGRHISMKEVLSEIYDLDFNRLSEHRPREIIGKGEMVGERDITLQFHEKKGLTCGAMYLVLNTWADELEGLVAVRNPYFGIPVVVKILLYRVEKDMPSLDKVGIDKIKTIVAQHFA